MLNFFAIFQGVLTIFLGTGACLILNDYLIHTIVVSTCLAGLLGSFIFFKQSKLQQQFYCGCFIAMSSHSLLYRFELTLISIIIASVIFNLSFDFFKGHGGKLGAIAFLASLAGFIWII